MDSRNDQFIAARPVAAVRPNIALTIALTVSLTISLTIAMLVSWMSPPASADDSESVDAGVDPWSLTAQEVLDETTTRVLAIIEEARAYVDKDPERYYAQVDEALDEVVDYSGFARGVMGDYATSARYRSLDEAGREQLRDQLNRFSKVMRTGLIRTYSKGLLAFGGSRVELDGTSDADASAKRATLRQLIYSDETEPFVVVYTMARDSDGAWRMRNLVVENVNLGQIYRSQFESAARRYDGDLDKVIDNWSVETGS